MPPPLALILFVVVQLVPGWVAAASLPAIRERLTLSGRLAAAVALSIAQLTFVGLVLISLGIATPVVIVVTNLAITLSLAIVARSRLRRDWETAVAATRAYRPEWTSIVAVAIVAIVVGIAVSNAFQNLPAPASAWGYAADVAEVLEAGGLPDTNLQYGEEVAFAATKTAGFAWLGAISAFAGLSYSRSVQLLPLALMFGALVATWAIFRSYAGRPAAAMGVLLLFFEFPFHSVFVVKFSRLTIEGAGITLGLLAVWAVIAADRQEIPGLRWLAAAMMVLAGLTHGVSAAMTVVFIGSYQLARILLGKLTWRQIYRYAFVLGVVPGLGFLVGVRLWSRAAGFALTGGGYELVAGTGDPTLALRRVLHGRSILSAGPPRGGVNFGRLFDAYFGSLFSERSPLHGIAQRLPIVMLLVVVVLIAIVWLVGNRELALTATLVMLAIFAFGIVFAMRYDLHVFRTHPLRREFPYAAFPVIGLFFAAASAWKWPIGLTRRGGAASLVAVLAAGSVGLAWVRAPHSWAGGGIDAPELAALDWVREQTPEDSWILANVRTTAAFGSYAERRSLTEGDTPYIYPQQLTTTLSLLDGAQRWFKEPTLAYLQENGIDYVVAARRQSSALGGDIYARMDSFAVLDDQPFLVRETRFKHVVIYSVER